MTYQETPYQKVNIVDVNGNVISSFGGGGDASATNQQSQIALETAIRDRLPSALVGGRLAVDVQSLNVTVNNAQLEIANDVGNPIPVNGTVTIGNSSIEIANDVGNPVPISGTVGISGTPTVTISNSSIEIANDVGNPVPVSGTVAISNSSVEIANDVGNPIPVNGTVSISGTPTVTISNSSLEIANDVGNPVPITITGSAIAPTFASLPLTNANTEYSFTFTSVKKYSFKVLSGGGGLRFTNVTSKVAGSTLPYYTLDSTTEEVQDFLGCTFTGTLYFASPTAGTTVLIQYWV